MARSAGFTEMVSRTPQDQSHKIRPKRVLDEPQVPQKE